MSKKTLIVLSALLGIFLAFLSFEARLSECKLIRASFSVRQCPGRLNYVTTTDLVTIFLARVGVIILVSGGLLFLLGKRGDESISVITTWKSAKEKSRFLFPYSILVYIGVVLISFLIILGIVYSRNPVEFTRPFPSPNTGGDVPIPSAAPSFRAK